VFGVVAALGPMDIEISGFEIHVLPAQRDKFGCTQPVAKHQQDDRRIAHGMPARFARGLHHGLDFIRSEIVAHGWPAFLLPWRRL
jgi:hypothetical protein